MSGREQRAAGVLVRNELEVLAVPDYTRRLSGEPLYRLHWIVDGRDLLDRLRQNIPLEVRGSVAELRRASGRPVPARDPSFAGVREEHARGRYGLQWVDAAREPGPVALLALCPCGEWGCSAVVADVRAQEGVVSWSNIRPGNGARNEPRRLAGPGVPDLHFDADSYDVAFKNRRRALGPLRS